MPPFPGEERLVNLFTDCHYYFAQPTARPVLHRFDKASYFYIYWNSTRHTSRIEVANNAGTPEQDAFNGHLDTCRVVNSYKFPNLVTIIVDAIDHAPSPTTSRAGRDLEEWQLQSADPRDTTHTKYRLHTIDFYFWTQEDAKLVTDFFRKLLNPVQLDLVESKQQPQQQNRQSGDTGVSSVVQNLEHVAISDPAYSNGQTRNSQNQPQSQATSMPLPPPPPPPSSSQPRADPRSTVSQPASSPSPVSPVSHTESRKSPKVDKPVVDYTPMAYNPAAPAAPEKIAHREKTPPPEDGEQGTGLTAAARHEQVSKPAYNPPPSWGAPPTTSQLSQSHQWGSPPPPTATPGYGSQISSTAGHVSPQPSSQYQQSQTSTLTGIPSFAPPPINTLISPPTSQDPHRHSVAAEMYTPDPRTSQPSQSYDIETPGSEFYNTIQQPSRPLQHVHPQYPDYLSGGGTRPGQQPPPGGWSEYSYAHNNQSHQSNQVSQSSSYDVHNQVYRPTEAEANAHSHRKPSRVDTALQNSKKGSKVSSFIKKAKAKAELL